MTRFVVALVLVLLSVSNASAQFSQKGRFAVPEDAGLVAFPIFPKVLTMAQMAQWQLTVKALSAPTVVYNHFRGLHDKNGRFVLETLPVGTIVLVDDKGVIRYKADCGNRLVEVKKLEPVVTMQKATPNLPTTPAITSPVKVEGGFWSLVGNGLYHVAMGLVNGLKFVLNNFGWYLLLFIIFFMLFEVIRSLIRGDVNRAFGEDGGRADTVSHPLAPTPVVAAPAPTGAAQTLASQIPVVAPHRETERTDGVPSTVYVNMGNDARPHLLTWNRGVRSLSFTKRPDGSHKLRVDNRA